MGCPSCWDGAHNAMPSSFAQLTQKPFLMSASGNQNSGTHLAHFHIDQLENNKAVVQDPLPQPLQMRGSGWDLQRHRKNPSHSGHPFANHLMAGVQEVVLLRGRLSELVSLAGLNSYLQPWTLSLAFGEAPC